MELKKHKRHPYAVASFVLALLCIIPAINVILSVLAVIFGILALKDIRKKPELQGTTFAIIGITVGAIVFIATIIFFIDPSFFGVI